jgi:hypothetical protein
MGLRGFRPALFPVSLNLMQPAKSTFLSRLLRRAPHVGAAAQFACIHCGLPAGQAADLFVRLDGEAYPVCCRACQAIAEALIACGQADHYRERARQQHSA